MRGLGGWWMHEVGSRAVKYLERLERGVLEIPSDLMVRVGIKDIMLELSVAGYTEEVEAKAPDKLAWKITEQGQAYLDQRESE